MKSNDLYSLLSRFESTLSAFSFEELNSEEASRLKESFQSFKKDLRSKVEGETERDEPYIANEDLIKPVDGSRLIANVSHEIRTPLNGIIGFTDLLKESNLNTNQVNHVNAIQAASYSLLELVNELLEYSKLASGNEQVRNSGFNLFGLVRDVMFLCNTLVTNKKVTLTSNIDQDIPEVLIGDPSKLSQVLLNIMGNAIKFVEEGDVNLNITLSRARLREFLLEFKITDDGIGIAADKIDHIFDPFSQAENDTGSKYGGSGLGLAIVKQIIENLGGTINVKSKIGVGTTFKFTIPYAIGIQEGKNEKPVEANDHSEDIDLIAGIKILVFEDNELNQRLIRHRLNSWKCQVHITDDPDFGMKVLNENDIDLVLMDLRMPIMSGFEITKLIRNSDSLRICQIPIIALTADYTIRDHEECNAHGINDYLLKPFNPEELLAKITALTNKTNESIPSSGPIDGFESKLKKPQPLVNLDNLFEESGEDLDLLDNLVELFKKNIEQFIEIAAIQIYRRDIDGLAFSAHKLKAGLAMLNINSLLKIIEDIQSGCNEHIDWKHLEYLHARFLNAHPEVDEAIDEAVRELKKR